MQVFLQKRLDIPHFFDYNRFNITRTGEVVYAETIQRSAIDEKDENG